MDRMEIYPFSPVSVSINSIHANVVVKKKDNSPKVILQALCLELCNSITSQNGR